MPLAQGSWDMWVMAHERWPISISAIDIFTKIYFWSVVYNYVVSLCLCLPSDAYGYIGRWSYFVELCTRQWTVNQHRVLTVFDEKTSNADLLCKFLNTHSGLDNLRFVNIKIDIHIVISIEVFFHDNGGVIRITFVYVAATPCSSKPCHNGGYCNDYLSENTYTCDCFAPFCGRHCVNRKYVVKR